MTIIRNTVKLILFFIFSLLLAGISQPFVYSAALNSTCVGCHQEESSQLSFSNIHQDTGCPSCHIAESNEQDPANHTTTYIKCRSCHPGIALEQGHQGLGADECVPCHTIGGIYQLNRTSKGFRVITDFQERSVKMERII